MKNVWLFCTAGVLIAVGAMGSVSLAGSEPKGWDLLQRGGLVVLIRHALAPGFGDPPYFRLDDCATQRNLSEAGRRQAIAIGESFRRKNVPIGQVFSSQWCRCKETAELAFGAFQEHPALNSFFEHPELKASQTEALKALLLQARPGPGNLILVTHQVNITALTGVVPAEGEMVVITFDDSEQLDIKFHIGING